jgi:hypothetical protein
MAEQVHVPLHTVAGRADLLTAGGVPIAVSLRGCSAF